MIYCVAFSEVELHLGGLGFRRVGQTEGTVRFRADRPDRLITVRAPNVNGDVPEALINDAFDAAGLIPPTWNVFWCD